LKLIAAVAKTDVPAGTEGSLSILNSVVLKEEPVWNEEVKGIAENPLPQIPFGCDDPTSTCMGQRLRKPGEV
jgi:hypothetical protein